MIDTNKLTPTSYCILTLWLNGAYTTSQISKALGISQGEVKAAYREKGVGGHMPRPRQHLTRGERQALLDYLKHYRLDGGRLSKPAMFQAAPIKNEPDEPIDLLDPKSKAGKQQIRELANEAQLRRNAEIREKAERELGSNRRRGESAIPLSWLYKERLLKDPDDIVSRGDLDKTSSEMRRYECGLRLRQYLEDAQLSGFKEINMERTGAGSQGVSIPERYLIARSAVQAVENMLSNLQFLQITAVIQHDEFIWDEISTKVGRDIVWEDIRCALDCVAIFIGMMGEKAFLARWNYLPEIGRSRSRDEARETINTAKEIIMKGARA